MENETENKILPCPFCGNSGRLIKDDSDFYYVTCDTGGGHIAESDTYDTMDQAILEWNMRKKEKSENTIYEKAIELKYDSLKECFKWLVKFCYDNGLKNKIPYEIKKLILALL